MNASIRKRHAKQLAARQTNFRQLLLRAGRTLNRLIVSGLRSRGYLDVRPIHSSLLANLDADGNSLTVLAARANVTKQAAGQLARELEARGYVVLKQDARDARSKTVCFTESGWNLMLDTFDIVDGIERRLARALGKETMEALRAGLSAFVEANAVDGDERASTSSARTSTGSA